LLQDAAKEVLGLSSWQISEDNDDRFVIRVVAVDWLSSQKKSLVALYELDDIWRFPAGTPLSSKPKRLMFPCHRHEGAHWPDAAEVPVRLRHKSLDPICDCAKCIAVAFREYPCPTDVLEILKEKEIGDLCCHEYSPGETLGPMALLRIIAMLRAPDRAMARASLGGSDIRSRLQKADITRFPISGQFTA